MRPNNSLQPTVIPLRGLPAAELRRQTAGGVVGTEEKYESDFTSDLNYVIMEGASDTFDFSYLQSLLRKPSEVNAIEIGLQNGLPAEIAALCYMFAQARMAEKWMGTIQVIFSREKRRHAKLIIFVKRHSIYRLNKLLGERAGPLASAFYDEFWHMPSDPTFTSLTLGGE